MDIVLLFPGQGSQKAGMGRELADVYPAARAVFDRVDDTLGTSLSRLCFDGPAEELTLTHNAQPALFAHGAAVWTVARDELAPRVKAAAGHSLGEFTAHHAAGSLMLEAGARLVRRRGELMHAAGMERPGTMAAILGQLDRPVDEICASVTSGVVVAANYNSPEQVVISGEHAAVEQAMKLAKDAGAKRATVLNVGGAFHSPLMAPAAARFRASLDDAGFVDSSFPVYSNVNAQPHTKARVALACLEQQVTSPVRWTDTVMALGASYPDCLFVEMGPGTVLTRLVSRIAPQLAVAACGTPAELDALLLQAA